MPPRSLFVVASLVLAQAVPSTPALVRVVTRFVVAYERDFTSLVADEDTTQQVSRNGIVTATRRTHGELFSAFVDDDQKWMSIHDIASVDGTAVVGGSHVRELLHMESIATLAPRVAAENARYNLGPITRNFNEPTLALLLLSPAHAPDVSVERETSTEATKALPLVTLRARLAANAPFIRGQNGPVMTRATFLVEPDTGRVHHTTISVVDRAVEAVLDTTYELDSHVSAWVPVLFTEHYAAIKTGETTIVRTTLTNYRRFQTIVRIAP